MQALRAIRGMSDILPDETPLWRHLETACERVLRQYAYREIRLPLLERAELFSRAIGEVTDIVQKEMYAFTDRGGDALSLRPEGTAGCVRALAQAGMLNTPQKTWYRGPMFRYERPQKGRHRQFHQIGAEVFGILEPDAEAELMILGARLWRDLGLESRVELQLNSLGDADCRARYRAALVAYLQERAGDLDADSQRRLETNPLRILDSKLESTQAILADAPLLPDYLGSDAAAHFARLRELLDAAEIPYQINPRLVRGLDYYNRTVFEWVTETLGAQGAVCAGGRFDTLAEQLGAKPAPAAGFAMGLERLVLMLKESPEVSAPAEQPEVYIAWAGADAQCAAHRLSEHIRNELPDCPVAVHIGSGTLKSQMKKADRTGARLALILGDNELANNTVALKPLRDPNAEQSQVPWDEVASRIR